MTDPTPSNPSPAEGPPAFRVSELAESLWAFGGLFLGMALTAFLLPGEVREYAYSILLAAMVYLPVLRGEARGHPLARYGIRRDRLLPELGFALTVSLIVFPLFALGYAGYSHFVEGRTLFHPALPPEKNLLYFMVEQTLFIALPEEFFYRGWIQTLFEERNPSRFRILGGGFDRPLIFTSLLFALGHLATIPHPARLAVFFPSLLFGWMRARRGHLAGPILVHGLSNVWLATLNASWS